MLKQILTIVVFPYIFCMALNAQEPVRPLEIGKEIPKFENFDQEGKKQNFTTLSGKKGLLVVFVRSVKW